MVFGIERIRFLEERWREVAEVVLREGRRVADVKEAVVFGSVVKGKAMGASDLDIALVVRGGGWRERELLLKIHSLLPDEISEIIDLSIIREEEEQEFLKFAGEYVIISIA